MRTKRLLLAMLTLPLLLLAACSRPAAPSTATASFTATPTQAPTDTPTPTPTMTPTSTPTETMTPTPTPTATPTQTPTATPTETPTATPTSTPTATATATQKEAEVKIISYDHLVNLINNSIIGTSGLEFNGESNNRYSYNKNGEHITTVLKPYYYIINGQEKKGNGLDVFFTEDKPVYWPMATPGKLIGAIEARTEHGSWFYSNYTLLFVPSVEITYEFLKQFEDMYGGLPFTSDGEYYLIVGITHVKLPEDELINDKRVRKWTVTLDPNGNIISGNPYEYLDSFQGNESSLLDYPVVYYGQEIGSVGGVGGKDGLTWGFVRSDRRFMGPDDKCKDVYNKVVTCTGHIEFDMWIVYKGNDGKWHEFGLLTRETPEKYLREFADRLVGAYNTKPPNHSSTEERKRNIGRLEH